MRALILTPQFPLPTCSGARTRLSNLVREMGRRHDVHMISLITPDQERYHGQLDGLAMPADTVLVRPDKSFAQRAVQILRPSRWPRTFDRLAGRPRQVADLNIPRFAKLIRQALRTTSFDVVQLEQCETGRFVPLIRQWAPHARIVLDEVEIAYLAPSGSGRESERTRRFEQALWNACDAVVTVSEGDNRLVEPLARTRAAWTVPNGVDMRVFTFLPRPAHALNLMFLGHLRHPHNTAGLTFFCHQVWPLVRQRFPQLGLDVVGGEPSAEIRNLDGQHGIRVHGFVPDVRQVMDNCAGMVVPLRRGGGPRLRVLEAFASGLPVISTRLGCEGIDAVDGRHVLFAEDAEAFVDAIQCIIGFPDNAFRIATQARRLVEERYNWQVIAEALNAVWYNVGRGEPETGAAR